eukprot:CAMPEP_0119379128 /NCGR_PEP_ID=MMETSP1334-20130426/51404_1 /TAXON_ID=127549 /ORGANISM="Calcidiscus leptoporus, Strain RCC1130" /LENGTH=50 /DNA_ID=CAMNT_0007398541 /DNA_START=44 /DNA_END=196 /DNA_ORIENTATION=+
MTMHTRAACVSRGLYLNCVKLCSADVDADEVTQCTEEDHSDNRTDEDDHL